MAYHLCMLLWISLRCLQLLSQLALGGPTALTCPGTSAVLWPISWDEWWMNHFDMVNGLLNGGSTIPPTDYDL